MDQEKIETWRDSSRQADDYPSVFISLVVPVYNERESVEPFLARVYGVFESHSDIVLEIVFVDDGSTDETLNLLLLAQKRDQRIRIVELSRNFGKEAALTAGLQIADGRVIVPLDVDLQDPPELIPQMIASWREGYDVVLGLRISRGEDSWGKRVSANLFYHIHNWIAEPPIPNNAGDFRLMDRTVVEALKTLPESRRFMKGLFSWVGFKTTWVEYRRPSRIAGTSKFNGWRLWNFALEGMTSFSTYPLRIWSYLGSAVALVSFFLGVFIVLRVVVMGIDVPGYASLIVAVTFLGGLQLLGIGIVGEYLGRTYIESKRRPIYLVRRIHEPQI